MKLKLTTLIQRISGVDVMISETFSWKNLHKLQVSMYVGRKNDHYLVFQEKLHFWLKIGSNSQKIVIITLTPAKQELLQRAIDFIVVTRVARFFGT
jgi:hypothetical protein